MLNIRPECPGDVILMEKTTLGGVFQKRSPPVATRGQQKLNMCSLKLMLDKTNTVTKTEWALSAPSVVSTLGSLFVQRINPIMFFLLSTNPSKQ